LRTRAIAEHLRGVFTTMHYTNPCLPYLYLNLGQVIVTMMQYKLVHEHAYRQWCPTAGMVNCVPQEKYSQVYD